MTRGRSERLGAIRTIIREQNLRTQQALVLALRERGFDCTQATVSRDIAELRLCKLEDGCYSLGSDERLRDLCRQFLDSVARSSQMLLLKTSLGCAPALAEAIEEAELQGLVGCISDQKGILMLCEDDESAQSIYNQMMQFRRA